MMSQARAPRPTIGFVDAYCAHYQDLFPDVRSFEHFRQIHLGLLADLPRKSLPALARVVGEEDGQTLHHFFAQSPWQVTALRERRLALTKQALQDRSFILCIDETGDKKKGSTTDYVARQYIGNLGKIENGMVSVNAYGVLEHLTFPLLFQVFKPEKRLKATDHYHTKPALAIDLVKQILAAGFQVQLVLADCLYGESTAFIEALSALELPFVVAIRNNHAVWMPAEQTIEYTPWQPFERTFVSGDNETRAIREIIFGRRHRLRYYQVTSDPATLPPETTTLLMTNLEGPIEQEVGNLYGLRTWIEYGFKQSKNALGWADYRMTTYAEIERWWEVIFSVYLMVCLQTPVFQQQNERAANDDYPYYYHRWWDHGTGWKSLLNNLRLIIQPTVSFWLLLPWLQIVDIPTLSQGLQLLMGFMNEFRNYSPI